ncbi:MAG: tetratricopeptide repeat protein [Pirellulales bacterium]
MRWMPRLVLFWPGLPQLWHSGLWSGLVLAAGFAVLVDLLLVASFVWIELLSPRDLRLGWLAAGLVWGVSAILSRGFPRRVPNSTTAERMFRSALAEYLQGSWFEAEAVLTRLLRMAPRDVEGRLLLATLLRRTRRADDALAQLDRLERQRDAAPWSREIAEERQRIAEGIAAASDGPQVTVEEMAEQTLEKQAA